MTGGTVIIIVLVCLLFRSDSRLCCERVTIYCSKNSNPEGLGQRMVIMLSGVSSSTVGGAGVTSKQKGQGKVFHNTFSHDARKLNHSYVHSYYYKTGSPGSKININYTEACLKYTVVYNFYTCTNIHIQCNNCY